MLELLVAELIVCTDMQRIVDHVRENKFLTVESKEEIMRVVIEANPHCELNERSENT